MDREKFMQEARRTAHTIFENKVNGIMNLVAQAWAEGKRNAEVETLRAAIEEALDKREPKAEPKEDAVYPTWIDWLRDVGVIPMQEEASHSMRDGVRAASFYVTAKAFSQIPADIAQKLGLEPKETDHGT